MTKRLTTSIIALVFLIQPTGTSYACLSDRQALRPMAAALCEKPYSAWQLPELSLEKIPGPFKGRLRVAYDFEGREIKVFQGLPSDAELNRLCAEHGTIIMFLYIQENARIRVKSTKKGYPSKRYKVPDKYAGGIAILKIEEGVVTEILVRKGKDIASLNLSVILSQKGKLIDSVFWLHRKTAARLYNKYGDLIVKRRLVSLPKSGRSQLSLGTVNKIGFPLQYGGKISESFISQNGIMTKCRVENYVKNIASVYTLKGELIFSTTRLGKATIKRLAKKHGGIYVRRRVLAPYRLCGGGEFYFLPEYVGEQIEMYFDSRGNKTKLVLPETLTSPRREIDLAGHKGKYFSFVSTRHRIGLLLPGKGPKDIFLPENEQRITSLLFRLVEDEETVEVMKRLVLHPALTESAASDLLAIIENTKAQLYERLGLPHSRKDPGQDLLAAFKNAYFIRRRASTDLALTWQEKRELTKKVRRAIRTQNFLILAYSYLILDIIVYTRDLKISIEKNPNLLPLFFTYGIEGLRQAAWAYDSSKGAKFSTYAPHKIKSAIRDGRRKDRMEADMVSRAKLGKKRPRHIDQDGFFELEEPAAATSIEDIEQTDLWRALTKGFDRIERKLIIAYYIKKKTMKEISRELDLSETRISQIHSAIITRFRKMGDRIELLAEFLDIDLQAFLENSQQSDAALEPTSSKILPQKITFKFINAAA